jgi:hypothetical protein
MIASISADGCYGMICVCAVRFFGLRVEQKLVRVQGLTPLFNKLVMILIRFNRDDRNSPFKIKAPVSWPIPRSLHDRSRSSPTNAAGGAMTPRLTIQLKLIGLSPIMYNIVQFLYNYSTKKQTANR